MVLDYLIWLTARFRYYSENKDIILKHFEREAEYRHLYSRLDDGLFAYDNDVIRWYDDIIESLSRLKARYQQLVDRR